MRKLLIILCCFFSFVVHGQIIQYLGSPTTQIYIRGQLRVDSIVYLPLRDTTFTPSQVGAFIVKSSNGLPYLWSGTRWVVINPGATAWGSITGTIASQSDLITLLNTYQLNVTAGYGIKKTGSTLLFDSANVRKVDTMIRVNDSTISYTINGVSHSLLIRGTAAGGINSLILNAGSTPFNTPITFTSTGGAWSGTLVASNQSPNAFWAGPPVGSPAVPTFRQLVTADLPVGIPNGNLLTPSMNFSTGTSGADINWSSSNVVLGGTSNLNVPTAGPAARGALSSGDWTLFNDKPTSVNGQTGVVVTKNADSIKSLPVDISVNRNNYVLTFDSLNHKWYLAAQTGGGGGAGTVTNVATGYGLSGGPITTAGTILVDSASLANYFLRRKDSTVYVTPTQLGLKQNQLNGTGFVKASGTTISYDNSIYLTANQTITFTPGAGDVTGSASGTTSLTPTLTIGGNAVTYAKFQAAAGQGLLGAQSAGNYGLVTLGTGLSMSGSVLNATGGGAGTNNADSLRHLFVDSIGMRSGDDLRYNYTGNKFSFYQPNTKDGYLGTLYSKNAPPTSDFTANGVTLSTVSGRMQIAAITGGTLTATADLSAYGKTRLPRWKISSLTKVVSQAANGGFGVGIRSTNAWSGNALNVVGYVDLRTSGALALTLAGGNAYTTLTPQSTLSSGSGNAAVGDSIYMTFERIVDTIRLTMLDKTQGVYKQATYYYNLWNPSTNMANTGTFSLYSLGGTQEVDSLSINSQMIKNAQLMYVGDSKAIGYCDSLYANSLESKTNAYIPTTVSWSEGADRTAEVLSALPEIYALSPKQVILCIGSNDPRSGVSAGTYQANFKTIYDSLTLHGIRVFIDLPYYETAQSLAAQVVYIQATYPAAIIIDTYTPILSNPSRFLTNGLSDGIHPNAAGVDTITQTNVKAAILAGGVYQTAGFINNQTLLPQSASYFISGSGKLQGGVVLGSSTFGTAAFPFALQTGTDKNIKMYQGTNMNLGAFTDAGTAGIPMALQFGKLTLSAWYGSSDHAIVTIDTIETASGGHVLIGTTTADATDAPFEVSTNRAVTGSFNSTNATGNGFAISNSNTVALYLGTGSYTTGAALGDVTIRANATGKIWLSKNGGTAMGLLDNGSLNLGSTLTTAASALLNLTSTTQGVLLPRMTLANFTAIGSKATGLHAQLTDSANKLGYYDGTKIVMYATTDQLGTGSGTTNIGSTQNALNYSLTSSTGTGTTLLTATTNLAGLMDTARTRYVDSLKNGLKTFTLTATNGLTALTSTSFGLGGTLSSTTNIATGGNDFSITGTTGSVTIAPKTLFGGFATRSWTPGTLVSSSNCPILFQPGTLNDITTASSGTVSETYSMGITGATQSASNTSVTYTTAFGLFINGGPSAGTNVTIGTSYALGVVGDALFKNGVKINAGQIGAINSISGGPYSISALDYVINCTSGTFTTTLPAISTTNKGQVYIIKNSGAGVITLATTGGNTIDGSSTSTLATLISIRVLSDGTSNWIVL